MSDYSAMLQMAANSPDAQPIQTASPGTITPEMIDAMVALGTLDEEAAEALRLKIAAEDRLYNTKLDGGQMAGGMFIADSPLEALAGGLKMAGGAYEAKQQGDRMEDIWKQQEEGRKRYGSMYADQHNAALAQQQALSDALRAAANSQSAPGAGVGGGVQGPPVPAQTGASQVGLEEMLRALMRDMSQEDALKYLGDTSTSIFGGP